MERLVFLIALLLFTQWSWLILPARGIERPSPILITLEEAVAIAKKNNPDYEIARHRQKAESEKVNQVWGMLYPAIESEASLARQGAESGFLSLADGQYDVKVVQLRFGINPGSFYHGLQMSRKSYQVATEEIRRVQGDIELRVTESYFNLLLAEEMVNLGSDTLTLLREHLKDVQVLYKTGSVSRFSLLQAQVRLNSQEPLQLEAENRYRIAREAFNYQLGSEGIVYGADRGVLERTRYPVAEGDIDDFEKRIGGAALRNRPEILQLSLKREIAGHAKGVQSSQYLWPTFTAGGYYGFNRVIPNFGDAYFPTTGGVGYLDLSRIAGSGKWQGNWQVRVAATYRWGSLLPVDSARAREREAGARMKEAMAELEKIRRLIAISIKSSYSSLLTAHHSIDSHRANVETAREGLRIARESYRAGVITSADLFGAQVALTQARAGFIKGVNEYHLSLAKLKRETGIEDVGLLFGGENDE